MMAYSTACFQSTTLTVLVVEDEPLQRMSLMDLVEEAGYDVAEASDADQALIVLESRPDIRIILADVDMPGSMDGLRLAATVRDRWPPIEIIVTSGRGIPQLSSIPARAMFLPKPLNEQRVKEALTLFA
ncbi:response regulator [Asaia krungthepensis]|uniref:Chemotaxis protein CheY n=1 Tax=Asaia krungthepensis NRIC 0535 TaxID=1307925 RepID=A0ABQ0Q1Y0_9PROT|nr:response regulator [Asaia krungthepensis]GBQ87455.1 chemotaxis protein CheY [Asaia krungthepensis NRIC 0535]